MGQTMPPQSILTLPHSQTVDWDTSAAPDGQTLRSASVAQRPVRDALSGTPQATGPLGALQAMVRTVAPPSPPSTKISDPAYTKMRQLQPIQQRVSKLIEHRSNNVFSLVASGGESFVRYEMRKTSEPPAPQYSLQAVRDTVSSGSGVCSDTNHALFRAIVAEEKRQTTASFRDRAAGKSSRLSDLRPVSFALNGNPHGFVLWGDLRDPRQAPDALVADSWEAVPIVKTWSNTQYKNRPYTVKMAAVGGTSSIEGFSLQQMAQISPGPAKSAEVDAYLAAHNRPPVGAALLDDVYGICVRYNLPLSETTSYAERRDMVYRNQSNGEVFIPTIASHDYHRYRMATSNPGKLQAFRELIKTSEAS